MNHIESWSTRCIFTPVNTAKNFGKARLPGVCFCLLIVLASSYLTEHYGSSQILAALLLGMAFNSISRYSEFSAGINFCSSYLLRAGVAFLGVRITFEQINELGYQPVLVVVVVVSTTIMFSVFIGWLMKLDNPKSIISGVAVAICGASAAMAVASIVPNSKKTEQHLLCSLAAVTGLSTIAMIVYPAMLTNFGLSTEQIGIVLGASIHDVAQVLGAGSIVSPEVAELATYTKMLRVSMLVPVITILVIYFMKRKNVDETVVSDEDNNCCDININIKKNISSEINTEKKKPKIFIVPPFLIAFIALVIIANMNFLSAPTIEHMSNFSQFSLWSAMAALGTKTNPVEMWTVGKKPMLLLLLNTLFILFIACLLVM